MAASGSREIQELYEFGPFRVDVGRETLLCDGEPVPVTPKTFQILLVLLRHGQEVVTKDDLMKKVWPDTFVEEANLSRNIFLLRKALGGTPQDRYIVTVPGRGYRLTEPVRLVGQEQEVALVAATHSEIQIEMMESRPWLWIFSTTVVLVALLIGAWFRLHQTSTLTERDTVVLADFTNTTGDSVFDETLRQGMMAQIEQSPFLSMISDSRIQQMLKLMGRQPGVRITPDVAREICERTGASAVVEGSIAPLGSHYVLGLEAKSCNKGDTLVVEQVDVAKKEDVLSALSKIASHFRARMGESLASVEKYSKPLDEATTSSLDALKAYSTGVRVSFAQGFNAGIPFLERALTIDPQFALAYAHLGLWYSEEGESAKALQSTSKAYELRERASDQERFFITALYQREVTGNLDASYQTMQAWSLTYPRDAVAHSLLSGFSSQGTGRYDGSLAEANRALELDPDLTPAYVNTAFAEFYRGRMDECQKALRRATERKLETPELLLLDYHLAFVQEDTSEMQRVEAIARNNAGAEDWILYSKSLVLAGGGELRAAHEMSNAAVELAQQQKKNERAATFLAGEAVWEALFGNVQEAKQNASAALKLAQARDVEFASAVALALAGDISRTQWLAADLEKRFPEDTSVRFNYLPTLRGLIALHGGSPEEAIEALRPAVPYETAVNAIDFNTFFGGLYPLYVRGKAYMAEHKYVEAAAEFQRLLEHRGLLAADPVGAFAELESAKAYLAAGDKAKAKAAYVKLLSTWEGADPDIRLVQQVKSARARPSAPDELLR